MECVMTGATVRENPNDPDTASDCGPGALCQCDAPAVAATAERIIDGQTYQCFDGCRLIQSGRLERAPDAWGPINWPSIPLFREQGAAPVVVVADELIQQPGKVLQVGESQIEHVLPGS